MTAEEFYRKSIYDSMVVDAEKIEHDFKMSVEEFKQRHVEAIMKISTNTIQRMKEFTSLKCEEQRRICYENAEIDTYDWDRHRIDKDSILNSPMPEI